MNPADPRTASLLEMNLHITEYNQDISSEIVEAIGLSSTLA